MPRHDDEADGGEESGSAEAGAQPRGGPLLHRPHVPDHTSPEVDTHYHYSLFLISVIVLLEQQILACQCTGL